jgi:hypothetical protein
LAILALVEESNTSRWYLTGIDGTKFRKPSCPVIGCGLRSTSSKRAPFWKMLAAFVEEELVCKPK